MIEVLLLLVVIALLVDSRYRKASKGSNNSTTKSVVMDTSALIDGRVMEVAKAGFLPGNVIIAKKVLDELQFLADGRDTHKRERARYGLDIISALQESKNVQVSVDDFMSSSDLPVDEVLLRLAKKRQAVLCTTDFNLNKVASVEGIKVLNVNELAQALRPKSLPGEEIEVKILQKGEGRGQGVGYLDDGTMVVVENVARMKGKTVIVTVDRMIQTKAGKMVFASHNPQSQANRK